MFQWSAFPFLRVTLFFTLGILSGILSGFTFSLVVTSYTLILLGFCYIGLWWGLSKGRFLRYHYLLGIVWSLFLYTFGYAMAWSATDVHGTAHLLHQDDIAHYIGTVTDGPYEKAKTIQYRISVENIKHREHWKPCHGKVVLYLYKDSTADKYTYGDRLLIGSAPERIPPTLLEGDFDYQKYMHQRHIYHRQFIAHQRVSKIGFSPESSSMYYAQLLRNRAGHILKQYLKDPQALAVSSALLLGDKQFLDKETKSTYADTGTIHLLAVSGLHVGMIYLVLKWLLSWLLRLRRWKFLFPLLCISALIMYVLVTGVSPSVMRAAIMFSCLILADSFRQQSNIYNTLSIAAFVSLCIDPYMLFSLGFRFSYLAVLGIVYLQPRIYRWFAFESLILDKLWTLSTVTLAAQLVTFPLGLYYFHQFPIYFLISNIVAVPGASLILGLSFLVVVTAIIPTVAIFLASVLEIGIGLFNDYLHFLEQLPWATLKDISISGTHTALLMLCILLLILLFEKRNLVHLYYSVALLLLFHGASLYRQWSDTQKTGLLTANTYGNETVQDQLRSKKWRWDRMTWRKTPDFSYSAYHGESFLYLNSQKPFPVSDSYDTISIGHLVLGEKNSTNLRELLYYLQVDHLIISEKADATIQKRYIKVATQKGIPYHISPTDGIPTVGS